MNEKRKRYRKQRRIEMSYTKYFLHRLKREIIRPHISIVFICVFTSTLIYGLYDKKMNSQESKIHQFQKDFADGKDAEKNLDQVFRIAGRAKDPKMCFVSMEAMFNVWRNNQNNLTITRSDIVQASNGKIQENCK